MQLRKVPMADGLRWFTDAVNLGRRKPGAVFGAALLLMASLYAAAFVCMLPAAMLARGNPSIERVMLAVIPVFVALMLLLPVLLGGLMHVIREAESGREVRARDLYAPFRQQRAGRLAALGVLQIALAVLGGLLLVALVGPEYWTRTLAAFKGAMSGQPPVMPKMPHERLVFVLQLVFNYFSYATMLFGVPLVLFSGRSVGDAMRDGLRASVSNVGSNLLAAAVFAGAMLIAALVVTLLAGLLMALGTLVHPSMGVALAFGLYMLFGSVLLVVLVGGAYLAWRDTFGDAAAPPSPPAIHGFEA